MPLPSACGLVLANTALSVAPQGDPACSLALAPLGATLQLSPALGGAVLFLGNRSADNSTAWARCVLGALPAAIHSASNSSSGGWAVSGGDWGAVQTSGQLALSFPPCRVASLLIEPHDPAPVVQLMERLDLFLWQAAFAAPAAASNHALERKTALAWSDWAPGLERASELRLMQANSALARRRCSGGSKGVWSG